MATFEEAGIRWLSPGDIHNFNANPAFWVAKKLMGAKDTHLSPAICRADAVYNGIKIWLHSGDIDQGVDVALQLYQMNMKGRMSCDDARKEHDAILPMLDESVHHFQSLGVISAPSICRMFETVLLDGISAPFTSAADYIWGDRIVFLKTTHRLPSKPPLRDMQAAALAWTLRPRAVSIIYATMTKGAVYTPEPDDMADALRELVADAFAIQNLVEHVESAEQALSMLPLNRGHYLWSPETLQVAEKAFLQLRQEKVHGIQDARGEEIRNVPSGDAYRHLLPDYRPGDPGDNL